MSGVYYPRERLVEADLAERYGAARTAVRTALMELTREGFVEREPNRGARVRHVSIDEAIEIAEVRLLLQGLCFVRAAQRGTPEQKEELLTALQRLRDAVDGDDINGVINVHMSIAALTWEMAGHETAARMVEQLLNQRVQRQFPFVLPERRVASLRETARIVEGIVAGDVAAVEAATRDHLEHVVQALEEARDREAAQPDAAVR